MFSIFTHVIKPVRDTNREPGSPVIKEEKLTKTRSEFEGTFVIDCQEPRDIR